MTSKDEESDMAKCHEKMEAYSSEFATANINRKVEMASDMLQFLKSNSEGINSYTDISQFIEGLGAHWVNNQNPKVSQYGIEALLIIADAMQSKYKSYSGSVFNHAINKLGDTKESVREHSKMYILKTVEMGGHNPNWILERLVTVLTNKNKDMSLQAQNLILQILLMERHKRLSLPLLNDLLIAEIACLNNNLREEATVIILNLTERIGKAKVIEQLEKATVKASTHMTKKLHSLIDEIRATQTETDGSAAVDDDDEVDLNVHKMKRVTSVTAKPKAKSTLSGTGISKTASKTGSLRSKVAEGEKYALYSGPAGEADEAWFLTAFEDVAPVPVLNHRELENLIKKMSTDLKSGPEFWEKKVDALKKLRSLIINTTGYEEDILSFIKAVSFDIAATLKDLRSQVVRETCLTIAFISKELKNRIDTHSCEVILLQLMTNVSCSARVVTTCSYIALKFMFSHVTHSRLISALVQVLNNHKAREIRFAVCEFLELILLTWPVSRLEQNIPVLQELIRRGAAESSTEARMASRRAYWAFHGHFPEQAEMLMSSMDAAAKKHILAGDKAAVGSTSQTKKLLTSMPPTKPAVVRHDSPGMRRQPNVSPSVRSNSAIDLQAVQRAKARQQYAAIARQKIGSGASLRRCWVNPF